MSVGEFCWQIGIDDGSFGCIFNSDDDGFWQNQLAQIWGFEGDFTSVVGNKSPAMDNSGCCGQTDVAL